MARVKGVLFTLDAMLATLLILTAVVLYLRIDTHAQDSYTSQSVAQDVLLSLDHIKLQDVQTQYPWVETLYNTTTLNPNDSVLYTIAYLWVLNDSRTQNLSHVLDAVTPPRTSLALTLGGTTLYNRTVNTTGRIVGVSQQQITGLDKGKPVAGTSSSAYLLKLSNKETSSYAFFGGFVGQGNITVKLALPSDFNSSRISALTLALDTPKSFELRINGQHCADLDPVQPNMTPDVWNVSSCDNLLQAGNNSVSLIYDGLTNSYAAGGYLRADFTTDTFITPTDPQQTTYWFPEIVGVANLYDGIIVPSTLTHLHIHLHYHMDDPHAIAFLDIGEKVVWQSNRTGDVTVDLSDANLTNLDYALLSNTTVPVRFSAFNTTSTTYKGANADVVLITDYSGSMKKSIADWSQGQSGNIANCNTSVYPNPDIRRTHLARCLDKEVVAVLFNQSLGIYGNRLWPVHYVNDQVQWYDNPQDSVALTGYYNTYTSQFPQQGSGKTCISCALSKAYDIFAKNPGKNRSRYIILMSDGLPTTCTAAGCGSTINTTYGTQACEGLCDVNGQNCNTFGTMCTDSSCSPAITNAEDIAQKLHDDFNVTIYTIAYGPVGTCNNATQMLQRLATMTNGTYNSSTDPQQLLHIYRNISYSILDQIKLDSQTAIVPQNVTTSTLYGDSYIQVTHAPLTNVPKPNEIEVTRQSPTLSGCTPSFTLPSGVRLKDARLVSYSGNHWTAYVAENGVTVYNLSQFYVPYDRLGDPYEIFLPTQNLTAGSNTLSIRVGDSPTNTSSCSDSDSVIYTVYAPSASSRTPVLPKAEGCVWTIDLQQGGNLTTPIPASYSGPNVCSYTASSISYDSQDAMQVAVYDLLRQLDFDGDGRIFVSLKAEDLEILVTRISAVPYLWGPIVMRAEAQQ